MRRNLKATDLIVCALLAERRNVTKTVASNRRVHDESDFATHLVGVMGEYVVAGFLGARVDDSVSLTGDDKITDLRVHGRTVQVKTRKVLHGETWLYFNRREDFKADIAVLAATENLTTVHVIGWITREEFLEKAEEVDWGYGPRHGVRQSALLPFADLVRGEERVHGSVSSVEG